MQPKSGHQIRCILRPRQIKWMVQVLCTFVLILCLAVPALAAKKRSSQKKKSSPKKDYPASNNYLAKEMLKYLGVRYRSGGSSPSGVDCSGYVGLVYRNAYGLDLPHQSGSLFISSSLRRVSLDELKTGDLVFFTSSRKSKRINHVGIYLSEGKFVHAASGRGVVVSDLDEHYWSERIAGARRVPEQPSLEGVATGEPLPVTAWGPDPGSLYGLQQQDRDVIAISHSLGLKLGEERTFHVSLFQDSLSSPLTGTGVNGSFLAESVGLESPMNSASVQGVRLEKDIRPFSWLVVTPSFSYFNYEGELDETGLPRRSVGVDLFLGSAREGWRLSTGFRYLSLISQRGLSEEPGPQEGFDMSLTYSKRLTDVLSVSLTGERLQRYEPVESDLPQQERTFEDQRFSVLFSFSY